MNSDHIAHIELECTRLSIAYARAIDFRDQEAFLDLFTDDATLDTGQSLHGADAIREALRRRPDALRTRHVISNVFVDVLGPKDARGISYLTLYRYQGEDSLRFGPAPLSSPAAVGHYEDRFIRTRAGWRFHSRRLQLAFRRAEASAAASGEVLGWDF